MKKTFFKKPITKTGKIILSLIVGTLVAFGIFYIKLPPINPLYPEFWLFLAVVIAAYAFPFIPKSFGQSKEEKSKEENTENLLKKGKKFDLKSLGFNILPVIIIAVPIILMLIGQLISSTVFRAKEYANVIVVNEADFATDMKETDEVTNIALMDGASAKIIGNRTLGSLANVVSQYQISEVYTQINYKYTPKKVANLEYADFFKWMANRSSGVPGYVMVDPVNNSAEYIELEKPLKYVESAFLGEDLMRKLRFSYPTKIFDSVSFEVDDDGTPYYIVSCVTPRVFPFGAMDVSEVIIFDPCTGESKIYSVGDVPPWVDAVYSGQLAEQKYNWHGTLSGGFLNSIIGNKDCKQTTDNFGYIVIGDDVWYFTGVTSVTSDESNIGFIISNARTGEYKYYPVVGAEEYSAMKAAEGEVQEKGYDASFPSLINVNGQATYIMVLKDAGGLVKLYALVNVEQYGIVATGATQAEAMHEYKLLLAQNGIVDKTPEPEITAKKVEVTVFEIKSYTVDGNTVFYIVGEDGFYYKALLKDHEELVFISVGDRVSIEYQDGDDARIRSIATVKLLEAENESQTNDSGAQ